MIVYVDIQELRMNKTKKTNKIRGVLQQRTMKIRGVTVEDTGP